MSATLTIAKRELRANFYSPVAYVVICLSLVLTGLAFFNYEGGFWQANRASFEMLVQYIPPFLSCIVIPVLTMRLVAEERRSGTLEMLITLPVKDHQVILGKFLGTWIVVLLFLLSTLLFPFLMFKAWHLGALDWGPIGSGYLGLVFYSAAATAVGLLVSSLTESQILAFFISFVILAGLHITGWFIDSSDGNWKLQVLEFLSFQSRIKPFSRGLITLRDLVYFASIAILSLMASFRALERRKWA
jgi:ABC-2 type transport system permease protein